MLLLLWIIAIDLRTLVDFLCPPRSYNTFSGTQLNMQFGSQQPHKPRKLVVRSVAQTTTVSMPLTGSETSEVRVKMLDFVMPNLLYTISFSNRLIDCVENGVGRTIIVPQGFYNVGTFGLMLTTVFGGNWTIADDALAGKYTMRYNGAGTAIVTPQCYRALGFPKGMSLTFVSGVVTYAPNCYNLAGANMIELHSTMCSSNCKSEGGVQSGSDLVTSIPVNVGQGSMITYSDQLEWSFTVMPGSALSSFMVSLTDDTGTQLQTNGAQWCATFLIDSMV